MQKQPKSNAKVLYELCKLTIRVVQIKMITKSSNYMKNMKVVLLIPGLIDNNRYI